MKPPKKYTEWLQAHPAVWEALQEEKPELDWGDTVWDEDDIGLVRKAPGYEGGFYEVAVPRGDIVLALDRERDEIMWLPNLRQLRGLLFEADSGTVQTTDFGDRVVIHCKKDFATADEPEIACTALWAKVKGIDV